MSAERGRHEIDLVTAVRGLGALRPSRARSVLGPDHPLSRSTELVHALAVQATATAGVAVVGAIAAAERRVWGTTLLRVAVLVELTLLAILAFAIQLQREHVLRVIAGGHEHLRLAGVAREARRLSSPRHQVQLAGRLERALADARIWHQIAVASRPPEGVKLVRVFAREIDEIVQLLRTRGPALRGLAVLELFLIGGYGSALYAGDKQELQQQLWRIRYLLNPGRAEAITTPVQLRGEQLDCHERQVEGDESGRTDAAHTCRSCEQPQA